MKCNPPHTPPKCVPVVDFLLQSGGLLRIPHDREHAGESDPGLPRLGVIGAHAEHDGRHLLQLLQTLVLQ